MHLLARGRDQRKPLRGLGASYSKLAAEKKPSLPVSYVPRKLLGEVAQRGLLSSEALLGEPQLLEQIAREQGESLPAWRRRIKERLKEGDDRLRGPYTLFKPPPDLGRLPKNHPMNKWDLAPVYVDLPRLLADRPKTRVHGFELMPYDRWAEMSDDPSYRHRDLTPEEIQEYLGMPAEEIWATYSDPERKGLYAPDVPHAAVITPDGVIDSKYLHLPNDTA